MTFRLKRNALAALRATPPGRRRWWDAAKDERQRDHPVPAPAVEDLGLAWGERFLLAVGVHIACALIAVADRPAVRRRDRSPVAPTVE